MEYLHSYWRMEYVERPKEEVDEQNPFVKLPEKEDRQALIVARRASCYIMLNKFPYNPGHLLVVPYRPVPLLGDLNPDEQLDLWQAILYAQKILKEALHPEGFNIGFNLGSAAGAGIPMHLHCHIVPRWIGDTNFMPVLGQTKVLPQALEAMWERLKMFVK